MSVDSPPFASFPDVEPTPLSQRYPWLFLLLALLPAMAAVWGTSSFVTQDGPAHIYNAHILNRSLADPDAFQGVYRVHWKPLPNWAGHLLSMAMDALLPPRLAERMLTTLTLAGLAAAAFALRLNVRGPSGAGLSAAFCVLLALNLPWLLGFTSYLLGSLLFALTLSHWWKSRETPGIRSAFGLGSLLAIGYFCHPVSLGLTVLAVIGLGVLTPGPRWRRACWDVAAMTPLVPLGLAYLAMTRQGGAMEPSWQAFANGFSLNAIKTQLGWVDPITLSSKQLAPFLPGASAWKALITPVYWLVAGIVCLAFANRPQRASGTRPWWILGTGLVAFGLVAPDTLGVSHGHYLPQRIVLLGLVALLPALEFTGRSRAARLGKLAILGALGMQTLWVWDYAGDAERVLRPFEAASAAVGRDQRVGTVLADARNRFRANPLLHFDCLLGVDSNNVIWSNYETSHYYFPVQLRSASSGPAASEFEAVARLVSAGENEERARRWEQLLDRHRGQIDVVVSFGSDVMLESINARRFGQCRVLDPGLVRVWTAPGASDAQEQRLDLSKTSEPPARRR